MRPRNLVTAVAAAAALTLSLPAAAPAAGASAPSAASSQHVATSSHWSGTAPTTKPMSAADKKSLQDTVDTQLGKFFGSVPGAWVGVWDPSKGWAVVSSGNAVLSGSAARTQDHSRIGSVTKTFVATEILKLVDAGTLKLTDTISRWLPALARQYPYVADVTIGQLLGMRSGIPDYTDVPGMMKNAYENPETDWTARQLITVGLDSATALSPKPAYSNTNYLLLGEIARRATGKSIWTLVNSNVKSLRLTQTRLPRPGDSRMPRPASRGYSFGPGIFTLEQAGVTAEVGDEQTDDVTQWGQAAGAMYSTVADLGRWAATGLGTNELSPALARQRLMARPINGGALRYGLGMEDFGKGWIGHDGQAIGWETRVAYQPKTGAVAVVMVNETGSLDFVLPVLEDYFPAIAGTQ